MKIQVFTHDIDPAEDIPAYFKRRLLFAIGRFASKIDRIEAGVIDVNGRERGGFDKRCRIVAKVAGVGRLVVQADDAELLPLIDRTADRLGRLVRRKLDLTRLPRERFPN